MNMLFKYAIPFILLLIANVCFSQKTLTVEEAVEKATKFSKNISAADQLVLQQKKLIKASVNLPNPEFFWESPTGKFYTGFFTQSMEFPTVYGKQVQLQKQQVVIAEKEKLRSASELSYQIRMLYLAAQYNEALVNELHLQDSVFGKLQVAAQRQYEAGQIDYLQKTYTENEYGDLHNQYEQSVIAGENLKAQLQYWTGTEEFFQLQPLTIMLLPDGLISITDSLSFEQNPSVGILNQEIIASQKNLELQKSKALPGLAFGYFNQGERTTPTRLRFRAGLTIPLWFWQYKSGIQAAKIEKDVSVLKSEGFRQQLNSEMMNVNKELKVNLQSYNYFQKTGLPKSMEIINTAKRFFESGETDYINYLRNIGSSWQTKLKYLETINNININIITIHFLTGKL